MTVNTAPFELWQTVRIKAIDDCTGLITSILLDGDGVTYRVAYWYEGVRRVEWVHPMEICHLTATATR